MAWGAFANLIPQLPDFAGAGMNYGIAQHLGSASPKDRKNFITDTRKLRKHEYQDMVYSLRKAGLNPILATGASPGHAAPQSTARASQGGTSGTGVGSALAAHKQANTARTKSKSEIGLMEVNRENAHFQRANILQQYDINQATIDNIRENTAQQKALIKLHQHSAEEKASSAKKLDLESRNIERFGPRGFTWEDILRNMITNGAHSAVESGAVQNIWNSITGSD